MYYLHVYVVHVCALFTRRDLFLGSQRQLASAQVLLEDISNEIDYAQKQEDALKEVTGEID
jgi:hypothetical protein